MALFRFRIPSPRKSFAARTSAKRFVRHSLGVKAPRGMGAVTSPKRALQNAVYRNTTVGADDVVRALAPTRRNRSRGNTNAQVGIIVALIQLGLIIWLLNWVFG